MSFFDEISKTLGNVAQTVENKGRHLADIAKLNLHIAEEEKKLDEVYRKIGKKFVEKAGDKAQGGFAVLVDEIREREKVIEDYKNQLRDIKGVKLCEKCGAELSADASFCPTCGKKSEADNTEEPTSEE